MPTANLWSIQHTYLVGMLSARLDTIPSTLTSPIPVGLD